ncbi:AtpZ/AtpI family protein [Bacillaceae bacterium Marseille-Q3522]|nr:AtpZ/AtpI family protein [Bacillaceae bacterium Marseille-Q3522]
MPKFDRTLMKAVALTSSILSQLVGPTLIGIFGGRWMDRKLGTDPLFMILCLLIGLAGGVYMVILTVRNYYSGE